MNNKEVHLAGKGLRRQHLIADLCLLATTLIWGVNILVFKHCIGIVSPLVFNSVRLVFSVAALGVCVIAERYWLNKPLIPPLHAGRNVPWGRVAMFSFLTGFLYIVLFVMGIARTTAGNTALLLASMPMWTAILSFAVMGERLHRWTWAGLATTFAGTLIVTLAGGQVSLATEFFVGNLIMLAAAFCWASATVLSSTMFRIMTPLELVFISAVTTTPIHLLWAWDQIGAEWSEVIRPGMLAALVFSGALSTGIAYALWNTGVKILGGPHAAVYQNVVTLIAVCGSWLVLGETPLAGQIAGGIFVIAGVLVIRQGRKHERRGPHPDSAADPDEKPLRPG